MIKKVCMLVVAMLAALQLIKAQEYQIIMVSADGGPETSIAISNVQDIVFENSTMTVNKSDGDKVTGITSIKFSELTGIDNKEVGSNVIIFPNPVQKYLTVTGVEKNVKIHLLDINGKVLQTVTSQESTVEINVSTLQKGTYLLQVGIKVIKFIKQ